MADRRGRSRKYTIAPKPVIKIRNHIVDPGKWTGTTSGRLANTSNVTVASILRASSCYCELCGRSDDDPECGMKCYRSFRKQCMGEDCFEIKRTGNKGYGAFLKSGVSIKKGQYVGEYLGELLPRDMEGIGHHLYIFDTEVCLIDAEKAGNWTRFINAHCDPNVNAWAIHLGKRHVISFTARRDIGPGEELTFFYGRRYFQQAGIACTCDAIAGPHTPRMTRAKERTKVVRKVQKREM